MALMPVANGGMFSASAFVCMALSLARVRYPSLAGPWGRFSVHGGQATSRGMKHAIYCTIVKLVLLNR